MVQGERKRWILPLGMKLLSLERHSRLEETSQWPYSPRGEAGQMMMMIMTTTAAMNGTNDDHDDDEMIQMTTATTTMTMKMKWYK